MLPTKCGLGDYSLADSHASAPGPDRGNLIATNAAKKALEVFNAQGARRAVVTLPEAPHACAAGGSERRAVYAPTRGALDAVRMEASAVAAK